MGERIGTRPHKSVIQNRAVGNITEIQSVVSFDKSQVVLDTDMSLLIVKGKDVHVSRLTLERGEVDVEGAIDGLIYSPNASYRESGKSIFIRLFK